MASLFLSNLSLEEGSPPTFLELSMAEQLNRSAFPAFEYLVNVLLNSTSSWWTTQLWVYRTEAFYFAKLVLERHYLRTVNASFAEHFYGLKRSSMNNTSSKLSSLVECVAVPYLSSKSVLFRRVDALASVVFAFAYALQRTKFYSPYLRLQNITLQRLSGEDMQRIAQQNEANFSLLNTFAGGVRLAIVLSAVVFKIAQSYYAQPHHHPQQQQQQQQDLFKIPRPPALLPQQQHHPSCPLCGQVQRDPCVTTSGLCFCFACVMPSLKIKEECPVTRIPCRIQDVRRVFVV